MNSTSTVIAAPNDPPLALRLVISFAIIIALGSGIVAGAIWDQSAAPWSFAIVTTALGFLWGAIEGHLAARLGYKSTTACIILMCIAFAFANLPLFLATAGFMFGNWLGRWVGRTLSGKREQELKDVEFSFQTPIPNARGVGCVVQAMLSCRHYGAGSMNLRAMEVLLTTKIGKLFFRGVKFTIQRPTGDKPNGTEIPIFGRSRNTVQYTMPCVFAPVEVNVDVDAAIAAFTDMGFTYVPCRS